jgi:hypothetical protein
MYLTGVEDFSLIHQTHSSNNFGDSIANKEILDILDSELGGEERELYLKFRGGSKINKSDMLKLTNKIRQILGNNNG